MDLSKNFLDEWHHLLLPRTLLLALLLSLSVNASAQQDNLNSSLADMFELAWQRHPLAAGQSAKLAEAQAAHDIANSLTPAPASISLANLNDRIDRQAGKNEWELELAFPLWLLGQRAARIEEAQANSAAVSASNLEEKLNIAGEVRQSWWKLAQARAKLELATRRLETAKLLENQVNKRYKIGELARIDANLAKSEVLSAQGELLSSKSAVQGAEREFFLLTGVPAPINLNSENQVSAIELDQHPIIAKLAVLQKSAKAQLKVIDSAPVAAPELGFKVIRERSNFTEKYANNLAIKLTIPLAANAQMNRQISRVTAEAEVVTAQLVQAKQRLEQQIATDKNSLLSSEQQLEIDTTRYQLMSDNLSLVEKAFKLGESDLVSLLRIRASSYEAEATLLQQRINRAAAISRLNQSMGALP